MNNLWSELKRRNVVRVGIAYAVVGWVILQFVDIIKDILIFPTWFSQMVLVLLLIGFPIALILSWAFELTSEGLKKTAEVDKSDSITHGTGRKLNKMIIGGLVAAIGILLADKFILGPETLDEGGLPKAQAEAGASIAVLPFINLSSDPEQEYFSDGISEEILNVLAQVDGLSVASRTSAFAYKGQDRNISEIARDLKVDYVLEGSVRRSGNKIRITGQLIDARADRHLWSDTYDRQLTDIFEIQDEISSNIVAALKKALGITSMEAISVQPKTDNLGAYDSYLKGREMFIYRTDLPGSAKYLEQAVTLDPNFAAAWETLAATYGVMPSWGYYDRPYLDLSTQAADRAIALDANLSLAYAVKGNNLGLNGVRDATSPDWKKSFEWLNKAIANNPKNATAHLWLGINHLFLGYRDLALADFEACLKIDPAYGNCKRHKGVTLATLGKYRDAVKVFEENLKEGYPIYAAGRSMPYSMTKEGNYIGALLYLQAPEGFVNFPGEEWIEAVKNPDADHRAGLAQLEEWVKGLGGTLEDIEPSVLFVFGAYDKINSFPDYSYFIWWPDAKRFRTTAYFKKLALDRNYPSYWRDFGFPEGCRALGENDFECE